MTEEAMHVKGYGNRKCKWNNKTVGTQDVKYSELGVYLIHVD
jgi:hypothetical protein